MCLESGQAITLFLHRDENEKVIKTYKNQKERVYIPVFIVYNISKNKANVCTKRKRRKI